MNSNALNRHISKRLVVGFVMTLSVVFLAASLLSSCSKPQQKRDLGEIKSSGKLRVILAYDPVNYFIYRGTPMGYSYELAEQFAKDLGVQMEVVIVSDLNNQLSMLNNRDGDLVAHHLTVTGERAKIVSFSVPIDSTRQVLVQRKPLHPAKTANGNPAHDSFVTDPAGLAGKTIHLREESAYYSWLNQLITERRINLKMILTEGTLSTSDLIRKVHDSTIDYTIADDFIAATHKTLYPDLDFSTVLSPTQPLAWAVRKNSPELLRKLNVWLQDKKTKSLMQDLHYKYYLQQYEFRTRTVSAFYSKKARTISPFDRIIKEQAKKINWDWRLLASLIYEESLFKTDAQSWSGAVGLMQLMPSTAAIFKVSNLLDPLQNIIAGTKYLAMLQEEWKEIPDPSDRLNFILASYNIGSNHVRDAQMLAKKHGQNPFVWSNSVEHYLELKSNPLYYNDDAVKYGYCNGIVPVNYTRNIVYRYKLYSQVIPR